MFSPTSPPYLSPYRRLGPFPSSRTNDRVRPSYAPPHLLGSTAHLLSRALAGQFTRTICFPDRALPLHRRASPRSHVPVHCAGTRVAGTLALRPRGSAGQPFMTASSCMCAAPCAGSPSLASPLPVSRQSPSHMDHDCPLP
jgi:hypothetical protein